MATDDMTTATTHRNVVELLDEQALRVPDHPALSWMASDGIHTITWADYQRRVWEVSSAFLDLGLMPGDTVAILAPNVLEHYVADLAALVCGAATVSLYPTLVHEQLVHILEDAKPSLVIAIDQAAAVRVRRAVADETSTRVVCIEAQQDGAEADLISWNDLSVRGAETLSVNRAALKARRASRGGDDIAVYVYTSGTTGLPKGVMLTHSNLMFQMDAFDRMGFFVGGYRTISYLPLAHIAERLWSLYFPLWNGGNIMLCPRASDLDAALQRHRPTFFMGVPRIWEKLRDTARALLASDRYSSRRAEVEADRAVLSSMWQRQQSEPLSASEQVKAMQAREGVLMELRRDLGLEWTINPGCGAASLSDDLRDFWASIGIYLVNGYGLSETTGVVVWERIGGGRRGGTGFAVPGCEVAIADDGEILVRGPNITPGYRNMTPEESGILAGGWLATGDIGHLDPAGFLFVTDRKKEIIVNAAGKNISPTAIEEKISGQGFVRQVVAMGDGRPYIVGLLTVDHAALSSFAASEGIQGHVDELVSHPRVMAEAQRVVDAANERLSRPEQIKRFRLITDQWSVDTGELTPTFKLRRREVTVRYTELVETIYAEPDDRPPISPRRGGQAVMSGAS